MTTQANLTGIADFFYKNSKKDRRNAPPLWMNSTERAEWKEGQKIAKDSLWRK